MTDAEAQAAEHAARVRREVAEFGCHIAVLTDEDGVPICAFTVGLVTTHDHPEIVVFGLEPDTAEDLLDLLQEQLEAGQRFEAGKQYDKLLRTFACTFRPVAPRHVAMFTSATAFHGRSDFPMLQLFWPDKHGRYPWQPGVRDGHRLGQPVLENDEPWS